MIKNNYHTHAKYCNHAEGEIEDYIKVAIDNNFKELGFSDHMPVLNELLVDEKYKNQMYLGRPIKNRMEMEDVQKYIKEVTELKEKYSNKIKIFIGFECEYSEKTAKMVKYLSTITDYLILGMHYFYVGDTLYNTYSCRDMTSERVIQYANECAKALDTGMFKYMAHPDLFMFNYMRENGRVFTKECEMATRIIVESAIKNDVYLELNVHEVEYSEKEGLSIWRYPRKEFWDIVSEYKKAKVIIGMDAHKPENLVNENYYKILDFAKSCNIKLEETIEL